jgi:hypothetical protein
MVRLFSSILSVNRGDLRERFAKFGHISLGRCEAKLFFSFVGEEETNASIGHDTDANHDASLGGNRPVPPKKDISWAG